MKLVEELLQYPKHIEGKQIFMFTGNRIIYSDCLVMGGGNALACSEAYPSISKKMASKLRKSNGNKHNLFVKHNDGIIGCMFTKNHWKDPSDLETVIAAIKELKVHATKNPAFTYHLPYPAIGLGKLTREQLDEYVETLPDNVIVYVK